MEETKIEKTEMKEVEEVKSDTFIKYEELIDSLNELIKLNSTYHKKYKELFRKQKTLNTKIKKQVSDELCDEIDSLIEQDIIYNDKINELKKYDVKILRESRNYIKKHKPRKNGKSGLLIKKPINKTFLKFAKLKSGTKLSYIEASKIITQYKKDNNLNDFHETKNDEEKHNKSYFYLDKSLQKLFPSFKKVFEEDIEKEDKKKLTIMKDKKYYIKTACVNKLLSMDIFNKK